MKQQRLTRDLLRLVLEDFAEAQAERRQLRPGSYRADETVQLLKAALGDLDSPLVDDNLREAIEALKDMRLSVRLATTDADDADDYLTSPAYRRAERVIDKYHDNRPSLDELEERVMEQWRWGNLTRLGVANALVRLGFNQDYAVKKSNSLEERK